MVSTVVLALVVVQRLIELDRSRKHERRLRALGAVEHGRRHYPALVLAHVVYYLALAVETRRNPPEADVWCAAWLAVLGWVQIARLWTIASLGERWTTRVLVLPGSALVRRGPYRWLRHPNYLIVVAEIAVLALAFRAWVALALGLALQAMVLTVRLRVEERALRPGRARAGASCSAGRRVPG